MGTLPRGERRVLILRAGVGIGHVRTRRQVARLTHMRPTTVAKLERRGIRQLRRLSRTGGCGPIGSSSRVTVAAGMAAAGGTPSSGAPAGNPDRVGVLAEHRSGGLEATKPKAETSSSSLVPPLGKEPSGGGGGLGDYRDPLLIAAAILLAVALLAEVRRELTSR